MKMNQFVFGYILVQSVLFDMETGRLINIRTNLSEYHVPCITMKRTMISLLKFLLEKRSEDCIPIDDILYYVWDKNHLQSSTQRLWQVMKALKEKLKAVGIEDDFIIRRDKHSYEIICNLITPIYCPTVSPSNFIEAR